MVTPCTASFLQVHLPISVLSMVEMNVNQDCRSFTWHTGATSFSSGPPDSSSHKAPTEPSEESNDEKPPEDHGKSTGNEAPSSGRLETVLFRASCLGNTLLIQVIGRQVDGEEETSSFDCLQEVYEYTHTLKSVSDVRDCFEKMLSTPEFFEHQMGVRQMNRQMFSAALSALKDGGGNLEGLFPDAGRVPRAEFTMVHQDGDQWRMGNET
jgi:hypothetical protein